METTVRDTPHFKIIQFNVNEPYEVIQIDGKLSAHLSRCKGILVSVKNFLNTELSEIPEVGEVSLRFNSRKTHPLHSTINYTKVHTGNRPEFSKVSQQLMANQPVTGFYLDYGKVLDRRGRFLPYTVNIYFECECFKEVNHGQ